MTLRSGRSPGTIDPLIVFVLTGIAALVLATIALVLLM